jgi:mRNA interferase MazF
MNRHLDTTIVMPLTSGSQAARFRVPISFDGRSGFLLGDQIRTSDYRRMHKLAGRVDAATLAAALAVLREMFEE